MASAAPEPQGDRATAAPRKNARSQISRRGRERLAEAMRERWAAKRAAQKTAASKKAPAKGRKKRAGTKKASAKKIGVEGGEQS